MRRWPSDSRVHAWQIRERAPQAGYQTYLVKTEPEAERCTEGETYEVTCS